jgi:DNA uptake protein ComE-like DNA-binding protein
MAFQQWLSSFTQSELQQLRTRLLSDPYYRFRSFEEVQLAASLGLQIDVNQATVDDWLRLPGLSIHQARSLVELTRSGLQFHCLEDVAAALSISVERLKPLQPILRFCYYDTESLYSICTINPNTATVEMLMQIPAVDNFLARAIVNNRSSNGPYRNLADLQQRLYLPGQLIADLLHYLRF